MDLGKLTEIVNNIDNGETHKNKYCYYGIRYHYNKKLEIGEMCDDSNIWLDGEATKDEWDGTCALDIMSMVDAEYTIDEIINSVSQYSYDEGEIIIIAGDSMEHGNDDNEIIIRDAVRVA